MSRIYISGPMTGYPNNNRLMFDYIEAYLKSEGFDVVNPAKLPHDHGKTWAEFMKEDIAAEMGCDYIFMLPGWIWSNGARVEWLLSRLLGIKRIKMKVRRVRHGYHWSKTWQLECEGRPIDGKGE